MRRLQIILVAGDESRDHASRRRDELASSWAGRVPVDFAVRHADRLTDEDLSTTDAAILVSQRFDGLLSLGPIRLQLEDAGIPMLLLPGAFLVATLFCLNFIADGLRDAFDPNER